ncbi:MULTISPECIES: hypothetical protein [unclassified Streptomyces]|uniref:hypothetical protein n=1 Tax=Streptomyces sp. T21Q-yed TaxID=3018441 RepID=UPI002365100D|nr:MULTISPECIES: hypothetical protein [unclassified Streptomyces]MDF3147477.1 hypothetical protein [Streptomyces sp. T21Q-yed]WDF40255.1 hypothetical protein PBV52_27465 [Streptomyces sp. T12]
MHRLLPPSAIAGVSVVCALAPWVFTEPMVLRGLAAAAAATAVIGAVVMRRWDTQAGKRVADLTRARASDEWRYEERVAELETDLEESRELRVKLEQRLRAKRTELAGLRNEHAALLRRYATAETERASVLEERRVLEIEAATPVRALPPASAPVDGAVSAAAEGAVAAPAEPEDVDTEAAEETPQTPAVFSPEGSRLFLRASAALARLDGDEGQGTPEGDGPGKAADGSVNDGESSKNESSKNESSKNESSKDESSKSGASKNEFPKNEPPKNDPPKGDGHSSDDESAEAGSGAVEAAVTGGSETEPALEDEAQGKPEAVDGHERAAAIPTAGAVAEAQPALPAAQQPSGHFIAPTAVAVVPATPVRRAAIEGGFDFFGTKQGAAPSALESVQNEDLADVVGQEALALHKAESEAEFKPADEESRGIGQVIDLTAHDETEQIDVQGLRSAVS